MLFTSFKTQATLVLFIFIQQFAFSTVYLRYNHAGYFPQEKKRVIISSDNSLRNATWNIQHKESIVATGNFSIPTTKKSDYTAQEFNYEITFTDLQEVGTYNFTIESENISQQIEIKNNPYEGIKFEVLKTIRARRSGNNDALIHATSHLGDSICMLYRNDGNGNDKKNYTKDLNNKTVNAAGGWYDAGDYIKFTLTNAYTTYQILKTYNLKVEQNKRVKQYSTTKYNDLLDEAIFGLAYLEKMFPDKNTFIIQVADETDHTQGTRLPENDKLNGKRKAYAVFAKPQMALTVAALALGAKTLQEEGNTVYADQLSSKAISLYETMQTKGINSGWYQKAHEIFYKDETYKDNIKLAAIELYNLTNDTKYLHDANTYHLTTSYWSSWGDISMTASNATIPHNPNQKSQVTSSLEYFKTIADKPNNIWNMPHSTTWGTLYSYFGVANSALSLQINTGDATYKNMAIDVLDYTMGLNNWGKAFVVSANIHNTIQNPYAQLYKLNPDVLAIGEIAEGPTTKTTHSENTPYFYPAHNATSPEATFNTNNLTFFDQSGDYVCMETTITGLADGLLLLGLSEKVFATKTLTPTHDIKPKKETQGLIIYPNPSTETMHLDFNTLEVERCSIFDINGNHVLSIRPHNATTRVINVSSWSAGTYTTVVFLKNGKTKMETFEKI